jgi:hypothetical protein
MAEPILTDSSEQWKSVVGFEGWYSVSNIGRVRRDRSGQATQAGRILTAGIGAYGYRSVELFGHGKRKRVSVHRLVAAAFLGPCPQDKQVNHISGNKLDNRPENLEYVTTGDNTRHAWLNDLCSAEGEHNGRAKLTYKDVQEIRAAYKQFNEEQARKYNVTTGAIRAVAVRRRWNAKPLAVE